MSQFDIFSVLPLQELPVGLYQVLIGTIKQWVKLLSHAFWGFDPFRMLNISNSFVRVC